MTEKRETEGNRERGRQIVTEEMETEGKERE